MAAPFQQAFELIFVLKLKNTFSKGFTFKWIRDSIGSTGKYSRDFPNVPPFECQTAFYVTISGNIERIKYFNFENNVLANKNLFQKIGMQHFM